MIETSALLTEKLATITLAAATVATEPPVQASMVATSGMLIGSIAAPRRALLKLAGSTATPRTLTSGKIWGWDAVAGAPSLIGFVADGAVVTVATTRTTSQFLDDALACFSHIGVTGTLAGDSLVIGLVPLEVQG